MLFISWNLCKICLFKFIPVEGGMKFMKYFKRGGAEAIKVRETLIYADVSRVRRTSKVLWETDDEIVQF
jgi:hypothetical protein